MCKYGSDDIIYYRTHRTLTNMGLLYATGLLKVRATSDSYLYTTEAVAYIFSLSFNEKAMYLLQVNKMCSERGVFFTYVDLRWGISTEQSSDGQTIAICLQEVGKAKCHENRQGYEMWRYQHKNQGKPAQSMLEVFSCKVFI